MGSRERDRDDEPKTHHQVSSMVVRPSNSGGGGGGSGGGVGAGGGSDYEQGEVRRGGEKRRRHEDSFYARPDRFYSSRRSQQGYEVRAGSESPLRPRRADHHYGSDYDHPSPHHGHGFGRGRGAERIQDLSPTYGRGRGGPSYRRDFDRSSIEPVPLRGEAPPRNNPNVSPREGDWICSDPRCGNLNFARRSYCNNCKKLRYESDIGRHVISPRRGYPGSPPPLRPPLHMSGPPVERIPRRDMNGYGSPPPRVWGRGGPGRGGRGGPREYAAGPMSPRDGRRFPDHRFQMERPDYREEDFRNGRRFERPLHPDWVQRDGGRGEFLRNRREYSDRSERDLVSPSPPQLTHRDQWARDAGERSRSPVRSGGYKDYRGNSYMGRGRNGRRGGGRGRLNNYY